MTDIDSFVDIASCVQLLRDRQELAQMTLSELARYSGKKQQEED